MRKIFIMALMGLSSSVAFADFYVYESAAVGDKEFECRFRGGKDGLRCRVKAEIEKDSPALATNEKDAKLVVECNNGFELRDRDAHVDWENGTLKIKGRDNGDKAILKIIFDNHDATVVSESEEDEFRARLRIESDGKDISLRGRCELDNGRRR